jgi:hypothetical protein
LVQHVQGLAQDVSRLRISLEQGIESRSLEHMQPALDEARRLVEQAELEHSQQKEMFEKTEAAREEILGLSQEQVDFIRRYKPGTVEVLEQSLAERIKELDFEREKVRQAHLRTDQAERELAVFRSQTGMRDLQELQQKLQETKEDLENRRGDVENFEQMKIKLNEQSQELEELRLLKGRYEQSQQADRERQTQDAEILRLEGRLNEEARLVARARRSEEQVQRTNKILTEENKVLQEQLQTLNASLVEKEKALAALPAEEESLRKQALKIDNDHSQLRARIRPPRQTFAPAVFISPSLTKSEVVSLVLAIAYLCGYCR